MPGRIRPLTLDKKGAALLFQIFTERGEREATTVASNASFGEWDKAFTDPRLCAAVADRLTFKCILIETGTDSYRLATTEAEQARSVRIPLSPRGRRNDHCRFNAPPGTRPLRGHQPPCQLPPPSAQTLRQPGIQAPSWT
ncbi:ATP-binding protein [Streptomyces sp. NPDC093223]|uniref:ATP-binding protein n=1 Tax=Streptomyces sp. NPDC093223 TaxID=3366033 RepID=UPI00382252AA